MAKFTDYLEGIGTMFTDGWKKFQMWPTTTKLNLLKTELLKLAMNLVESLKEMLDKNTNKVAEARVEASQKGLSTEETCKKIEEATKDTKLFNNNEMAKSSPSTTKTMEKSTDVGNLIANASKSTDSMALAGSVSPKQSIGLDK